jgi:hypothetical protein
MTAGFLWYGSLVLLDPVVRDLYRIAPVEKFSEHSQEPPHWCEKIYLEALSAPWVSRPDVREGRAVKELPTSTLSRVVRPRMTFKDLRGA